VASNPDVIYLPDFYTMVNLVTRQAREKGIFTPFLGSDAWDSPELDLSAIEGSYYTNHMTVTDKRPVVQNFIKNYGTVYRDDQANPKVPDILAALAYDATNMMLTAIEQAGVDDPAIVKDVLAGMRFEGVTGLITFDKNHTPLKDVFVLQVRDGKIVYSATVTP
jgi:branched-chain amino acid transport system substrate-binding protein